MSSNRSLVGLLKDAGQTLDALSSLEVYPVSVVEQDGVSYFMGRTGKVHKLGILCEERPEATFDVAWQTVSVGEETLHLGIGDTSHANAIALREVLPFTAPICVGIKKSAGLGDRLGIATPGHVQALRHAKGVVPVLAQQSIREMERTDRNPDQVMDAATWGVFQAGWREGFGSDADHLKTFEDIDYCAAAGFLWYTFDPREHVDNDAEDDSVATLEAKFARLPWDALGTSAADTRAAYLGKTWNLDGFSLTLSEEGLLRAACKYGRALAHLASMYRHLVEVMGERPFEVEVSVDETETPTKPEEHLYIASELERLGLEWNSLAPRYIGRFEKGVDYIGDLKAFEETFAQHVAIAKAFGPYKLSLHSGSDKFSIYPIAARLAGELVHLKTAGTSYLEALRAVARVEPSLFREILAFAIDHYEIDKASYHVSAQVAKMIKPEDVSDEDLADVLDQFDTRQALHVTFGSVLTLKDEAGQYVYKDRLYDVLESNEEEHYAALESHIVKHVMPFSD